MHVAPLARAALPPAALPPGVAAALPVSESTRDAAPPAALPPGVAAALAVSESMDDAASGVLPWLGSPPFIPASPAADNVHKPLSDLRSYRFIRLPNGLRALLISDPRTEKAAAALTVGVGHLSDPPELAGLSHFLEHMLFLGTAPFPEEASYKAFLKEKGGASNASTSAESTTYHFSVNHAHLPEALARFCAFFTSPLFTEGATDRELSAVDSENARNLSLDGRRQLQVSKHLSAPGSVWAKFGTGNLRTLRAAPAAAGIDVRAALLRHYRAFYSANIMTLAVLGREPLAALEDFVAGRAVGATGVPSDFSAVPNAGIPLPLHDGAPRGAHLHPYQRAQLGRAVFIAPVKDVRSLCVTWPAPPAPFPDWRGALEVVAHLLGHEGAGSFAALLKARGWANSVGAGGSRKRHFTGFAVDVALTPAGLAHADDVVRALLQAVACVRRAGGAALGAAHAELAQVAANRLRFRGEAAPVAAVTDAAAALQELPGVDALVGALLPPRRFDEAAAAALLDCLAAPRNMMVTLTAREFAPGGAGAAALAAAHGAALEARVEPFYGFAYATAPFSPAQLAHWGAAPPAAAPAAAGDGFPPNDWDLAPAALPPHPDLALPPPNAFIPSDFSLLVAAAAAPAPECAPRGALPPHARDIVVSPQRATADGGGVGGALVGFPLPFPAPALLALGAPLAAPARSGEGAAAAARARGARLAAEGAALAGGAAARAAWAAALAAEGGLPARVFYHGDGVFRRPRTLLRARVRLPRHKALVAHASRARSLAPLFCDVLQELLEEPTFAAAAAGLGAGVGVDVDADALELRLSGYTEKAGALLEIVLAQMAALGGLPDAALAPLFERCLEKRARALKNWEQAQPVERAEQALREALAHPRPPYAAWLAALQGVALSDLREFASGLFDSQVAAAGEGGAGGASVEGGEEHLGASVELLVYGNALPGDALAVARRVAVVLGRAGAARPRAELAALAAAAAAAADAEGAAAGAPAALLGGRFPSVAFALLPPCAPLTLTRAHPSATERNCGVVTVLQLGAGTHRNRAAARLLGTLLGAPFFAALRTREQLGYVVSATSREGAVAALVLRVQASAASVEHVAARVDAFLAAFRGGELAALSDGALGEVARIAAERELEPDKTAEAECARMWGGAEAGAMDWADGAQLAAALRAVTADDLRRVWDERVAEGGRLQRRATCRVYAQARGGGGGGGTPPAGAGAAAAPLEAPRGDPADVPPPAPGEVPEGGELAFKAGLPDDAWLPAAEWL